MVRSIVLPPTSIIVLDEVGVVGFVVNVIEPVPLDVDKLTV
ncbi:hypothetical protein [Polaribacter sp.]